MNRKLYSNKEFQDIIKRIDNEMIRRGSYKWNNPLSTPKIGEDKYSEIDDSTYTTHNVIGGTNTSADHMTYEEMIDALKGLAQIHDIDLFYGKDETPGLAYRDPIGISQLLEQAESDQLNEKPKFNYSFRMDTEGNLICEYQGDVAPNVSIDDVGNIVLKYPDGDKSQIIETLHFRLENDYLILDNMSDKVFMLSKVDPNGGYVNHKHPEYPVEGINAVYPVENGQFVMPSGEYDGEELIKHEGLGPSNFYDDYGAQPGDGNYHPFNHFITPQTRRDWNDQDNDRKIKRTIIVQGGIDSSTYGMNPRNPNQGNQYISRPVYQGVPSTCQVSCTGLCSISCDNECSESCTTTCWNRCGNACIASCGNLCTGCSSQCMDTCKTKCQNTEGFACVKSGASTVNIISTGGTGGVPAKNTLSSTTYSCNGCSYSCEFYPNKKTTCWDAGCMGQCFTSCEYSCSDSCHGGCIDNGSENKGKYKIGKGRGCSAGCTINCVGLCQDTCSGECVQTCYHGCKQECTDNCSYECTTSCGAHCANYCSDACTGCASECSGSCRTKTDAHTCSGCSSYGGSMSTCMKDCSSNCNNWGCAAMCGSGTEGACVNSCRINCSGTSCTAMCNDQCSSTCTSCINTCGFQCGACSSLCSTGCEAACNITCSAICSHSCDTNCVHSCSERCGGCSNLCYSCVSMCIGVCSVKCESGCTNCTLQCAWWCDSTCSRGCSQSCDGSCSFTCSSSCIGGLSSTAENNREEERESFKIIKEDNE